jgi:hypothetical protein
VSYDAPRPKRKSSDNGEIAALKATVDLMANSMMQLQQVMHAMIEVKKVQHVEEGKEKEMGKVVMELEEKVGKKHGTVCSKGPEMGAIPQETKANNPQGAEAREEKVARIGKVKSGSEEEVRQEKGTNDCPYVSIPPISTKVQADV